MRTGAAPGGNLGRAGDLKQTPRAAAFVAGRQAPPRDRRGAGLRICLRSAISVGSAQIIDSSPAVWARPPAIATRLETGLLDRRIFLAGAASSLLGACTTGLGITSVAYAPADGLLVPDSDEPFRVAPVDMSTIPNQYHRRMVSDPTGEPAGAVVVDPGQRFLYLVMSNGKAMRYGIGVGRQGFSWNGVATIGAKRKWPSWHPPVEMQARDPRAREWRNGMPGGPSNPLGARALYLDQGGRDTLYRIHGTNEPQSIGRAVSSGCIRMLNADVIDLYERVPIGTRVVVLPSLSPIARLGGMLPEAPDVPARWRIW